MCAEKPNAVTSFFGLDVFNEENLFASGCDFR
jgi:hypothetical protein